MKRIILSILVLSAAIGGLAFWYSRHSKASEASYRTEDIKRGRLVVTVSSTGTLEPEDVIDVGTQVAGMIRKFGVGTDGKTIDYGSPVNADTELAYIDDSLFAAKVKQSRAQLHSSEQKVDGAQAKLAQAQAKVTQAKSNTQRAEADLLQAKAKSVQASRDYDRARRLEGTSAISQADVDAAQAANDTNKAGVTVADAAIAQAKAAEIDAQAAVKDAEAAVKDAQASVEVSQAILTEDEINLGYCTITSSVKGTVIDRRVSIGQTVQSSFNTPSLFLIATDLQRMKVWAQVNEADIGQIKMDQKVTFTVDASPGQTFSGSVARIRLNAINTNNVVTYTVEVLADNSSGKLYPYMTANLRFQVDEREDALLASNAALRYRPPAERIAPEVREAGRAKQGKERIGETPAGERGVVWVEDGNGYVKPVRVRIGVSDGNMTEIIGGDLKEEMKVVVGEAQAAREDDATNPFAPRVSGKKQ